MKLLLLLTIIFTIACTKESPSDPLWDMENVPNASPTPLPSTDFSVTIEQRNSQNDPTDIPYAEFIVSFARDIDVGSFSPVDIQQAGSATGVSWSLTQYTKRVFLLKAVPTTAGTIIPQIGKHYVYDPWGNRNIASTSNDNDVTYFITPPVYITINQKSGQQDPTKTLPLQWDINFSQEIDPSSFSTSDLVQGGTATGVIWSLTNSGNNLNYTLEASFIANDGTVIPSIPDGRIFSLDNSTVNVNSTSSDNIITYDTTAPNISITSHNTGNWVNNTISLSGNCDESGTVNISIAGTLNTTANCNGVSWSKPSIDLSTLIDQYNMSISVNLSDSLGNNNNANISVHKDATAPNPVTSINFSSNDANLEESALISWLSATDAMSGVAYYNISLGTSQGGEEIFSYKNIGLINSYRAKITTDFFSILPEDTDLFFSIEVFDFAGNNSTITNSSAFRVRTPNTFNNNVLWLDTNKKSTIFNDSSCIMNVINDNEAVGCWMDRSGNNNNLVQNTNNKKPLYRSSLINGKDIIEFDGGGSYLEDTNGATYINSQSNLSVFAIVKSNLINSDNGVFRTRTNSLDSGPFLKYSSTGNSGSNLISASVGTTNAMESSSNLQNSTLQLIEMNWSSGGSVNLYINGYYTIPSFNGDSLAGTITTAQTLILGKSTGDNNNSGWDGDIVEFIIIQGVLAEADRVILNKYLNNKWNIW